MAVKKSRADEALYKRIRRELVDDIDEELELEIDDGDIADLTGEFSASEADTVDRTFYFRELLRLPPSVARPVIAPHRKSLYDSRRP